MDKKAEEKQALWQKLRERDWDATAYDIRDGDRALEEAYAMILKRNYPPSESELEETAEAAYALDMPFYDDFFKIFLLLAEAHNESGAKNWEKARKHLEEIREETGKIEAKLRDNQEKTVLYNKVYANVYGREPVWWDPEDYSNEPFNGDYSDSLWKARDLGITKNEDLVVLWFLRHMRAKFRDNEGLEKNLAGLEEKHRQKVVDMVSDPRKSYSVDDPDCFEYKLSNLFGCDLFGYRGEESEKFFEAIRDVALKKSIAA